MKNLHPIFFDICENIKRAAVPPTEPIPPAIEHPLFGPVIHSYTRAEAIQDGVLINLGMFVSQGRPVLELVGLRFPVAMTSAAYELVIGERDGALLDGAIVTRRVIYFLSVLKRAILSREAGQDPTRLEFTCTNAELKIIALKSICGPGDNAEPVITVMLPRES
jgi:hypothetical protein